VEAAAATSPTVDTPSSVSPAASSTAVPHVVAEPVKPEAKPVEEAAAVSSPPAPVAVESAPETSSSTAPTVAPTTDAPPKDVVTPRSPSPSPTEAAAVPKSPSVPVVVPVQEDWNMDSIDKDLEERIASSRRSAEAAEEESGVSAPEADKVRLSNRDAAPLLTSLLPSSLRPCLSPSSTTK
jgi:hypothetical protein